MTFVLYQLMIQDGECRTIIQSCQPERHGIQNYVKLQTGFSSPSSMSVVFLTQRREDAKEGMATKVRKETQKRQVSGCENVGQRVTLFLR